MAGAKGQKGEDGLKDFLMKKHGGAPAAPKPNPAYAGLPPNLRAIMERQDREGLMKTASAAQGKGTVSGGNVQAGQQAQANVAATKERMRQKALKAEDEGMKGTSGGLRSRRGAANKLQGR